MPLDELVTAGFPRNLTPVQKEALDELQNRLVTWRGAHPEETAAEKAGQTEEETKISTTIYCKFLRARQFNVDASFALYTEFLTWKKEFQGCGVANIRPESVMNEIKTGKCLSYGQDHDGRPVIWIRFHLHKKSQSDPVEAERFIAWFFENAKYIPRKSPIETTTVVVDLSNIGRDNMDLGIAKAWANMLGTKYPECLGQGLLLNAPWIFSAFWRLLTPVLDARTTKKLKFINQTELGQYMPEETILKEYGGKGEYDLKKDPVYSRASPSTTVELNGGV